MTPPLEEAQRLLRLARRDGETFYLLLPLHQASLAALGFLAQNSKPCFPRYFTGRSNA
jgi:hypothetical protein